MKKFGATKFVMSKLHQSENEKKITAGKIELSILYK